MKPWKILSCGVVLAALSPISVPQAAAAPVPVARADKLATSRQPLIDVQYRRWHHRHHHYGSGYRHHRGSGTAVLGGLAAGAIIGGAIANSQARANDTAAYCAQRYRSYDPASGTYLGYDGNRHPCP